MSARGKGADGTAGRNRKEGRQGPGGGVRDVRRSWDQKSDFEAEGKDVGHWSPL